MMHKKTHKSITLDSYNYDHQKRSDHNFSVDVSNSASDNHVSLNVGKKHKSKHYGENASITVLKDSTFDVSARSDISKVIKKENTDCSIEVELQNGNENVVFPIVKHHKQKKRKTNDSPQQYDTCAETLDDNSVVNDNVSNSIFNNISSEVKKKNKKRKHKYDELDIDLDKSSDVKKKNKKRKHKYDELDIDLDTLNVSKRHKQKSKFEVPAPQFIHPNIEAETEDCETPVLLNITKHHKKNKSKTRERLDSYNYNNQNDIDGNFPVAVSNSVSESHIPSNISRKHCVENMAIADFKDISDSDKHNLCYSTQTVIQDGNENVIFPIVKHHKKKKHKTNDSSQKYDTCEKISDGNSILNDNVLSSNFNDISSSVKKKKKKKRRHQEDDGELDIARNSSSISKSQEENISETEILEFIQPNIKAMAKEHETPDLLNRNKHHKKSKMKIHQRLDSYNYNNQNESDENFPSAVSNSASESHISSDISKQHYIENMSIADLSVSDEHKHDDSTQTVIQDGNDNVIFPIVKRHKKKKHKTNDSPQKYDTCEQIPDGNSILNDNVSNSLLSNISSSVKIKKKKRKHKDDDGELDMARDSSSIRKSQEKISKTEISEFILSDIEVVAKDDEAPISLNRKKERKKNKSKTHHCIVLDSHNYNNQNEPDENFPFAVSNSASENHIPSDVSKKHYIENMSIADLSNSDEHKHDDSTQTVMQDGNDVIFPIVKRHKKKKHKTNDSPRKYDMCEKIPDGNSILNDNVSNSLLNNISSSVKKKKKKRKHKDDDGELDIARDSSSISKSQEKISKTEISEFIQSDIEVVAKDDEAPISSNRKKELKKNKSKTHHCIVLDSHNDNPAEINFPVDVSSSVSDNYDPSNVSKKHKNKKHHVANMSVVNLQDSPLDVSVDSDIYIIEEHNKIDCSETAVQNNNEIDILPQMKSLKKKKHKNDYSTKNNLNVADNYGSQGQEDTIKSEIQTPSPKYTQPNVKEKACVQSNYELNDNRLFSNKLDYTEEEVDFDIPVLHECETLKKFTRDQLDELMGRGVDIKLGRWTRNEDKLLLQNLVKFSEKYDIPPAGLLGLGAGRVDRDFLKKLRAKRFYLCLGKDLNNRTLRSIYLRARLLLDTMNSEKKCSAESVRFLQKLSGNKWSKIGSILNCKTDNCAQTFRWHQRDIKKGDWDPEEVENLIKGLKEVSGGEDFAPDVFENISWTDVAQYVPTRNFSQCRHYWASNLLASDITEKWDKECYRKLIRLLCTEYLVEDSTQLNWKEIYKSFLNVLPAPYLLQKKWAYLKYRVPDFKIITHKEILQWLSREYLREDLIDL